jgi:hypothetical protein
LKTAPTTLKKLGQVDTPTFSTESAESGNHNLTSRCLLFLREQPLIGGFCTSALG